MMIDFGPDIQKLLLIFFRVLSILWLLPIFSSKAVVFPYKAGLSMVISYLLFDVVTMDQYPGQGSYLLLLAVIKEIFVGLTISFFVRILFSAVNVAAEVAALQAGFTFARVMDPVTMGQVTVLEQFKNLLAIMVFFSIDAHHIIIRGLFSSFKALPIGNITLNHSLLQYMVAMTGKMFTIGLKIGAPLIVTLFITELSLGLLSKMIPQINVFVEGMPIKILITCMILSLSLGIIVPNIANLFRGMDAEILKIMRLMV
jgi:flagellar biosynthesis protein FliR